jgi:hypothetical protein
MCGDDPEQDLLTRLSRHARPAKPSGQPSVRDSLADGALREPDAIYKYMDELFQDVVRMAVDDVADVQARDRDNLVRSQSLVLARAAGLLAGHLGGRDDFIRMTMEALLEGYAAATAAVA